MFTLSFDTKDEFFEDKPEDEIERILDIVKVKVAGGIGSGVVRDINGNRIGTWEYQLDD